MIDRLPETTHTLYAELLDQCIRAAAEERRAPRSGSFVSKEIKGRMYWYFQRVENGQRKQTYLGRDSQELRRWMGIAGTERADAATDVRRRRELVGMLTAGGAVRESAAVEQVLRTFADNRVFAFGGVLIGTHAFMCYANILGVRFEQQTIRTGDIDLAQDVTISVALSKDDPPVHLLEKLKRVEPHFIEVPPLDFREPSTSFRVRGRDLRVDFLTAAHSRHRGGAIFFQHLGIAAQPLPAIDYILESSIQAVVVAGGGVLVNVPDPARFALHKLWVMRERPSSEQAKVRKDLRQAEQLLEVLLADRPRDVERAWKAAMTRSTMSRKLRGAIRELPPALRAELK